MSLFSAVGLTGAFFAVVCWYPFISFFKKEVKQRSVLWNMVDKYLGFSFVFTPSVIKITLGLVVLIAIAGGLFFLKADDDIRLLRNRNDSLQKDEAAVFSYTGQVDRSRFFIVEGSDINSLLQNGKQVAHELDKLKKRGALNDYVALSDLVPSEKEQRENLLFMQKVVKSRSGREYLNALNIKDSVVRDMAATLKRGKFLTLHDVLQSRALEQFKNLWLGKVKEKFAAVIMLKGINDMAAVKKVASGCSFLHYVDKVAQVSLLFRQYRKISTWLVALAYALIALFLFFRYGLKQGFAILFPPLFSALTVLGIMGYAHFAVNIFTIFALILTLGIGIDYTLFFAEAKGKNTQTGVAVMLSAITTVLSFGLLWLSSTPALKSFGFTILVGIATAFLLSPVAGRKTQC
jgi:predicted exporter